MLMMYMYISWSKYVHKHQVGGYSIINLPHTFTRAFFSLDAMIGSLEIASIVLAP